MFPTAGSVRVAGPLLVLLVSHAWVSPLLAQTESGFVSGQSAQLWTKWEAAAKAILARDAAGAETLFGELLAEKPAPMRIALLAEHAVLRTSLGGAVLLLEQDYENKALGPNATRIAELLIAGREQLHQADDGWYFASIGRFDVSAANFRALLAEEPDPVALLEFAERNPRRHEILLRLVGHPQLGEQVRQLQKLLERGDQLIKADPTRIREHLDRIGGPPRAYENAVARLKDSGEYAIPFIVQYLRDAERQNLTEPIVRALPQVGRPALNPLLVGLRMEDQATKRYLIRTAGQLGYLQALPYLLQLRQAPTTPTEVRLAVDEALADLRARGLRFDENTPAAEAFYRLAEAYYADTESLAADSRLDTANVWYWRDDLLQNVEVPTPIFNEIMCLRLCEEALRLNPAHPPALALWLAANFRREAQLAEGQRDPTRPPNYPTAAYFAQSAGPEYCLLALDRAVADRDPAVAFGAIEALRRTAGPAALVSGPDGRLPLAQALSFPDRMVRIRAALALANARPTQPFQNYQNLMPVMSEALMLFGGARNALVVDPDEATGNPVAAALRVEGFQVLTATALFPGLEQARTTLPGLDVIVLASDCANPPLPAALAELRGEFRYASTPVVILAKSGQESAVRELVRADVRLGEISPADPPERVSATVAKVAKAVGAHAITPEVGTSLALEAAMTLRLLAETNNPLFNVADAEPALIAALATDQAVLKIALAQVLGFVPSQAAQETIASIALDEAQPEPMRVAMFSALADAAKRRGSQLGDDVVTRLTQLVESEPNMLLRESASQTLGALNLPGSRASAIVRNQYGG